MKKWILILTIAVITVGCNKRSVKVDPKGENQAQVDTLMVAQTDPKETEGVASKKGKADDETSVQKPEVPAVKNKESKPDPQAMEKKTPAARKGKMSAQPMMQEMRMSSAPMEMDQGGYVAVTSAGTPPPIEHNTESYDYISENGFKDPLTVPLSTFSIDVDAASYANMRRFLNDNRLPPEDAVRIEELINYFDYAYNPPKSSDPFSINTEISECPWNKEHQLVHIGLQGKKIEVDNLPSSNLVFLLDVSGSMRSPSKLPLLKKAFGMLVEQLNEKDRVSIAVYAGAAGLVLPATKGNEKHKILSALENLEAGGSTAGGAGIHLAYKTAAENFIRGGNNRVILATDGDFNVGASSDGEMVRLIEEKRNSGVFLTVLGFGTGNFKDSKMEKLADKGNGNYAYIDNLLEAKKVLVSEMGGTLHTIAKDVKIQVEFNPANVQAYRLVGYENRLLNAEDFNDDKKDAGELGSGHTVTALYEIVPPGVKMKNPSTDPLKYQKPKVESNRGEELLTVKFRYKAPNEDVSKLITRSVDAEKKSFTATSDNFRFSSAVAGFGMLLRNSEYKGSLKMDEVLKLARESKGKDEKGYRAEFIKLVELAQILQSSK